MNKTAVIIGVDSCKGVALARFLLAKQYQVHAFVDWNNLEEIRERLVTAKVADVIFHTPDLEKTAEIVVLLRDEIRPDEIYSLADVGHGRDSSVLRLMEALKQTKDILKCRFFQEQLITGGEMKAPQVCHYETPNSCLKMFTRWTLKHYREEHGLYTVNGAVPENMLVVGSCSSFMNEICLRLAIALAEKKIGSNEDEVVLELHSNETYGFTSINQMLDRHYEWVNVDDLAEAMWLALNNSADDFIIASGQFFSLRNFCCEIIKQSLGFENVQWHGTGSFCGHFETADGSEILKISDGHKDDGFGMASSNGGGGGQTEDNGWSFECMKMRKKINWNPKLSFDTFVKAYLDNAIAHLISTKPHLVTCEGSNISMDVANNLCHLEE